MTRRGALPRVGERDGGDGSLASISPWGDPAPAGRDRDITRSGSERPASPSKPLCLPRPCMRSRSPSTAMQKHERVSREIKEMNHLRPDPVKPKCIKHKQTVSQTPGHLAQQQALTWLRWALHAPPLPHPPHPSRSPHLRPPAPSAPSPSPPTRALSTIPNPLTCAPCTLPTAPSLAPVTLPTFASGWRQKKGTSGCSITSQRSQLLRGPGNPVGGASLLSSCIKGN